jgi:hypothetical protein
MSLLTQFYGGGGSSSSSDGFAAGLGSPPAYLLVGNEGGSGPGPTPTGWASFGGSVYFPNVYATQFSSNFTTPPGIGIKNWIISNVTYADLQSSADLKTKKFTLANSYLRISPSANQPLTTSIEGTGLLKIYSPNLLPNLTTISTTVEVTGSGGTYITGSKLDAATVNHILESVASWVGDATAIGAILDLSGGTSAGVSLLTTAGAAARAVLIAAGWTVTLNA